MSGSADRLEKEPSEAWLEIMEKFKVDEGTAKEIVAFCSISAFKKMDKWTRNFYTIHLNKAEDVYKLVKELKRSLASSNPSIEAILVELEEKVLDMTIRKDYGEGE